MARKEKTVKVLSKGVESLFRKNKISRYAGTGRIVEPGQILVDTKDGAIDLKSRFILTATGSKPATLPHINLDGDRVATSTEALSYKEVPGHLVSSVPVPSGSSSVRYGSDSEPKSPSLKWMIAIYPEMNAISTANGLK